MSLYGNVKKIGSASFQFDRIYANRDAMDKAASSDGVYAGRYVLVEYGERFSARGNAISSTEEGTAITEINSQFQLVNTADGSVKVAGVEENSTFKTNAEIDLMAYGAVYDSTVWQKAYVAGQDKYIMVAELNAAVPKIEILQEKPLTYQPGQQVEDPIDGIVTGKIVDGSLTETVRLINADEIYNKAYFDTALDTELNYLMHLPTTLNLEIDNGTIDFNEKGFNQAYSYGEKEGVSTIAWIPKGLDNYEKLNGQYDIGGNPLARLLSGKDIDTKILFMSFPALGNAMNALYDLLYGRPEAEADLSTGALRPYFKQFLKGIVVPNFLTVLDEGVRKFVTIDEIENGENRFQLQGLIIDEYGNDNVISPIPLEYEQINYHFTPDFIISAYDAGASASPRYISSDDMDDDDPRKASAANWILCDTRNGEIKPLSYTFHAPSGDEDPDMEFLKNVPALSDILANNTAGLATILSSLFGSVDPLTGTVKYYLYNDWTAAVSEDSSGPAIINKPEIVGGYETNFINVPANVDKNGYETAGKLPNLGGAGYISYPHLETTITDNYSGGKYEVDYSIWQMQTYVPPELLTQTLKLPVESVPNDGNKINCEYNQSKITVSQKGNAILITSSVTLRSYASTSQSQGSGQWVALDIDTGLDTIKGVKWGDNYTLDENDINEAASVGLGAGHIIFWVKADTIIEEPREIKLTAEGFSPTILTVQYQKV